MKAYTNIKQSKELIKILPLKSADMAYRVLPGIRDDMPDQYIAIVPDEASFASDLPAWSLAALIDVLPKIVNTQTLFIETSAALWHIGYRDVYITRSENLVDACVDMIIKLKELKLL